MWFVCISWYCISFKNKNSPQNYSADFFFCRFLSLSLPEDCIASNHVNIVQDNSTQCFSSKSYNSAVPFSSIKLSQLIPLHVQLLIFTEDAAKTKEATNTNETPPRN